MRFLVGEKDVKKRLDVFLSDQDLDITRSYIKTLIGNEDILVNDKRVKSGYSLKLNDIVEVSIPEDKMLSIEPENIKLDIIYEDDDVIIINKKKGMVVHPGSGNYSGTLVNALMYSHRNNLSTINGIIRPGIVHRIDKDTSGILIVAKNDNAHKNLSEQFSVHSINRKYVALVKGIIAEDDFVVDLPIGRNSRDRKKMAITDKNSKRAVTHIKVLKRFYSSNVTLVEAKLETGRTHQIRVHMASCGHPLVGDEVYGKKDSKFKVKGQLLHAKVLGIIHPKTGEYMEFTSDINDEFKTILEKLENKENI